MRCDPQGSYKYVEVALSELCIWERYHNSGLYHPDADEAAATAAKPTQDRRGQTVGTSFETESQADTGFEIIKTGCDGYVGANEQGPSKCGNHAAIILWRNACFEEQESQDTEDIQDKAIKRTV